MLVNVVPPVCVRVIMPNAVPLPTAPVTLTVPTPVLNVKFFAEVFEIVPPKLILPPDVLKVVLAAKLTSSLKVWAPVVVIVEVLITTVPPEFVVKLVRAELLPTVPESVVVPVVLRVKVDAPLTVPPKVIELLPAEIIVFPVRTIGVPESPIDIAVFVD